MNISPLSSFRPGDVVWAPYANGEYRLRVVSIDQVNYMLTLKRPGSDGGTVAVPVNRCVKSAQPPHSLEDVSRA